MSSTQFSNMDAYADVITYNVYEYTHDGLTLPSTFLSKKDAYRYVKEFTDSSSNVFVYKTKCVRSYPAKTYDSDTLDAAHTLTQFDSPHVNSDYIPEDEEEEDYEEEDDEDYIPEDDDEEEDEEEDDEEDDEEEDDENDYVSLEGMFVKSYRKGYILVPPKDSEYYGEKYFLDGWWMPLHNGWFFKAEFIDKLIDFGAMYASKSAKTSKNPKSSSKSRSSESSKSSHHRETFSSMALSTYGKGYLLTAHSSHPNYGMYYYYDTHGFTNSIQENGTFTISGFWNSKATGWFFNKRAFSYLTGLGVKFIKDEASAPSSSFKMSDDLSSMTLTSYGKGYVLTPNIRYKNYGNKYFTLPDGGQGWWRKDLKAWFFKSEYFDELVDMGAKYIS